jgi:hypothetical protein
MATNGVVRERTSSEIEEDKTGLNLQQTKSIGGMTISPELFEKVCRVHPSASGGCANGHLALLDSQDPDGG